MSIIFEKIESIAYENAIYANLLKIHRLTEGKRMIINLSKIKAFIFNTKRYPGDINYYKRNGGMRFC